MMMRFFMAGFSSIVSSPTAVGNFNNQQFSASLQGSATAYVALLSSQTIPIINTSTITVNNQATFNNVSSFTITSVSSMTVSGAYFDVTKSTTAVGVFQLQAMTLSALASTVPIYVGQEFYCSNCTTDVVCASTQTTTATWARTSAKGTACN